ncbi:MAG: inositol monophosphatase [Anaerolineae bacterium]|nr:inositol monophosphatase [Anaerolineae bacterium]
MLQTAIEAAHRAGKVIAERYPAPRSVTVKGYRDIVTEVDTAAESIIIDLISKRFPGHAILSEEAGGKGIGAGITWVIDPLDGTTNYARRVPFFCTSVGVLEDGDPLAGAIYDPLRDQTFAAERGKGATLNGKPIHASQASPLSHTVLALDWGHSDTVRAQALNLLHRIVPCCGTMRALGSAALALAYVATGWLDGYFNLALKPWDAAAGMLLIAEAGGRCTTLRGEPCRVDIPACLTTNGLVHDELLKVIADAVQPLVAYR